MSREQLAQAYQAQVPPDMAQAILLTVQRYIHEQTDQKFKILTQQVMELRDQLRGIQHSVMDEFIESLVKSLTEDRVKTAFRGSVQELAGPLVENLGRLTEATQALYEEYKRLSGEVAAASSRIEGLERMLKEMPPARRVEIDTGPVEDRLKALSRQVGELEKKVAEIASAVASLEGAVKRALEGFESFVEELERTVSGREEEGEGA
jgi:predicted  nucleic acid-binding Zn-ribbon protein